VDINRELTWQYILNDPTSIILTPAVKTRQPDGSSKMVNQPPRAAQTFKLIPLIDGQKPTIVSAGVERIADYMLLGRHDAVVARDDWWLAGGKKYTVIEMAPGHGYEVKAMIEAHG
jgi:hypothetical protein